MKNIELKRTVNLFEIVLAVLLLIDWLIVFFAIIVDTLNNHYQFIGNLIAWFEAGFLIQTILIAFLFRGLFLKKGIYLILTFVATLYYLPMAGRSLLMPNSTLYDYLLATHDANNFIIMIASFIGIVFLVMQLNRDTDKENQGVLFENVNVNFTKPIIKLNMIISIIIGLMSVLYLCWMFAISKFVESPVALAMYYFTLFFTFGFLAQACGYARRIWPFGIWSAISDCGVGFGFLVITFVISCQLSIGEILPILIFGGFAIFSYLLRMKIFVSVYKTALLNVADSSHKKKVILHLLRDLSIEIILLIIIFYFFYTAYWILQPSVLEAHLNHQLPNIFPF